MRMVNLCKNKLFNTGLMLFLCLGLQAQNKEMRRVATNEYTSFPDQRGWLYIAGFFHGKQGGENL